MMYRQPKTSPSPSTLVRTGNYRRYNPRPFFLSIVVLSLLAIGSWVAQGSEQKQSINYNYYNNVPQKRMLYSDVQVERSDNSTNDFEQPGQTLECRFVRQADDQCSFIKTNCPDENGIFPYLQLYYCSLSHAKPAAFIIILLWLSMLFSTIGIAASDFLCVNLSTISSILGISESLAGVTFLAFGNGSPDVFSTFAAMSSNSGSLAVGELIGAACFITAVVGGSMALARPFRVARRSFVRDVGFFIVAASLALVVLADGELHAWECATMIGLYGFYVFVVVSWHWYLTLQRRKYEREVAARAHFHIPQSQELDLQEQPFDDDDPVAGEASGLLQGQRSPDFEALEALGSPTWKDDEDDEAQNSYLAEIQDNMHLTRPTSFTRRTVSSIRPSLVGALEFQSVLSSLKKSKNIHGDQIGLRQQSPRISATTSQHTASTEPQPADLGKDTPTLRLDTSVSNANEHDGTTIPLIAESSNNTHLHHEATAPSTSTHRLTVPHDGFHSPNYQVSPRSNQLSPGGVVSPTSTGNITPVSINHNQEESDNDTIQFPPFVDSSPTPPSLNLPPAATPPTAVGPEQGEHQLRLSYQSLVPGTMFFTLFPTLCDWKMKSIWAKVLSVVAAPSVFFLTATIPVVDPRTDTASSEESSPDAASSPLPLVADSDTRQPTPTIQLPEESPPLQPRDHEALRVGLRRSIEFISPVEDSQETHFSPKRPRLDSELAAVPLEISEGASSPTTARSWHRGLTTIQAFTSPLFIVLAVWSLLDEDHNARNLIIPIPCSIGISIICAVLLHLFLRGRDDLTQTPDQIRPLLSFIGFIVGICWIAVIADEVVSLLKTLGVILNISDSLLGLTVFAVGNSSSDLVADITVARLGYPVMALSACFGGPMLNILLGIGIGGLYMTLHPASGPSKNPLHVPFKIAISKTLAISGATLLFILVGLLIIVPLNNWKMDRKIGGGLIVLWTLSTLSNVIVEIVA